MASCCWATPDAISSWHNIWSMTNGDIRRKAVLFSVINSKPFVLLWLQHKSIMYRRKIFCHRREGTVFTIDYKELQLLKGKLMI